MVSGLEEKSKVSEGVVISQVDCPWTLVAKNNKPRIQSIENALKGDFFINKIFISASTTRLKFSGKSPNILPNLIEVKHNKIQLSQFELITRKFSRTKYGFIR